MNNSNYYKNNTGLKKHGYHRRTVSDNQTWSSLRKFGQTTSTIGSSTATTNFRYLKKSSKQETANLPSSKKNGKLITNNYVKDNIDKVGSDNIGILKSNMIQSAIITGSNKNNYKANKKPSDRSNTNVIGGNSSTIHKNFNLNTMITGTTGTHTIGGGNADKKFFNTSTNLLTNSNGNKITYINQKTPKTKNPVNNFSCSSSTNNNNKNTTGNNNHGDNNEGLKKTKNASAHLYDLKIKNLNKITSPLQSKPSSKTSGGYNTDKSDIINNNSVNFQTNCMNYSIKTPSSIILNMDKEESKAKQEQDNKLKTSKNFDYDSLNSKTGETCKTVPSMTNKQIQLYHQTDGHQATTQFNTSSHNTVSSSHQGIVEHQGSTSNRNNTNKAAIKKNVPKTFRQKKQGSSSISSGYITTTNQYLQSSFGKDESMVKKLAQKVTEQEKTLKESSLKIKTLERKNNVLTEKVLKLNDEKLNTLKVSF